MKKLAGSGVPGYTDGDLGSARFNKPNSFAVDYKGNLYVADKVNYVIRKISKSGVHFVSQVCINSFCDWFLLRMSPNFVSLGCINGIECGHIQYDANKFSFFPEFMK